MFTLEKLEGGWGARWVCDTCGEPISADRPGIVIHTWGDGPVGSYLRPDELAVVHKFTCDTRDLPCWGDLDVTALQAVMNAGIDIDATRAHYADLAEMGLLIGPVP